MLETLKTRNDIAVYDVTDAEFAPFGRVIRDLDTSDILAAAKKIQNPINGSSYLPGAEAFESLPIAKQIADECYGTLPTQVGYCWGYNTMFNATEWHTSSEINIAVTPIVLILGHVWDIKDDHIDASKFKAFYLPAGTVAEVYATSLHYCPCQVSDEGFGCVVALPKGTNTDLEAPANNPLLFRKNKWILAHEENQELIDRGVVAGITGTNYEIRY